MAIEEKKPGRSGWIKKSLVVFLVFLVLLAGGCSSQSSVPDRLREVDVDLQEYVTKLLMAADRLEQMERELAFLDPAFDVQMSAHNVRDNILEVTNNIDATRAELTAIADELE